VTLLHIFTGRKVVVNRCYDLTSGTWSTSKYQPIRSRRTHVAWNINPGKSFMLLGGGWTNGRNADKNVRTTDIVHVNGTVEQGFMLQYDVKFACAIEDKQSNSLIITGGYENRMDRSQRVTKYDKNGVHTDLPKLNYARTDHACGSYSNKIKQVFLVVGGWGMQGPTDSTEILVSGSGGWKEISPFPFKHRSSPRAALFKRGFGLGNSYNKTIFQFHPTTETWTSYGSTINKFAYHAVDLVAFFDFSKYCKV